MGIAYASGSSAGRDEVREFDFLIDTGATWLGLPQADIDALGLDTVPDHSITLMTGDGSAIHCRRRWQCPRR